MSEHLEQFYAWLTTSTDSSGAYYTYPWTWLAAGAVALVLLFCLWRWLWRSRPATPLETREDRPRVTEADDADVLYDESDGIFGALTPALAAQLPESQKESSDFAKLLRQAGLYSPTARASIYALRFVLLFVPLVLAGVWAVLSPPEETFWILVIGAAIAGFLSIIPRLYVFFRRRRRVREIRHGLADMMDMFSMCMGGGMPVSAALEHVADNLTSSPALVEELRILKRQSDVGSLNRALADFAARIDMPAARQVASLLSRGQKLGSRMSKSLLEQADHYRATRRQRATMQANKTPVKLALPLMFCFAPAALILLISPAMLELRDFLQPDGGSSLLTTNRENLTTRSISATISDLDQNEPQMRRRQLRPSE